MADLCVLGIEYQLLIQFVTPLSCLLTAYHKAWIRLLRSGPVATQCLCKRQIALMNRYRGLGGVVFGASREDSADVPQAFRA